MGWDSLEQCIREVRISNNMAVVFIWRKTILYSVSENIKNYLNQNHIVLIVFRL